MTEDLLQSFKARYSFPLDDFQLRAIDAIHAGNSVIVLTGHAFYAPSDFASGDGFFKSVLKNGLHASELGSAAS